MGTPTSYRPLGIPDQDLLAELHAASFDSAWDLPWSAGSFAEVLRMPGAYGFLAAAVEQPIGFGITLTAIDEVELLLLAILPAYRRRGEGGLLLDQLLRRAAVRHVKRAILEVAAPNKAAVACYTKAGFTPCGRRLAYYSGRIDAVILEKSLDLHTIASKRLK